MTTNKMTTTFRHDCLLTNITSW